MMLIGLDTFVGPSRCYANCGLFAPRLLTTKQVFLAFGSSESETDGDV